ADDKWRVLDDNRFCVILKGVSSQAELELATSKLSRLFTAPLPFKNEQVPLQIRAGFVALGSSNSDINVAVRQAEKALRRARNSSQFFQLYDAQSEKMRSTNERW
ncbi:MAG: diguanylate cyclase, partial [Halieaceae bacterium]|nr:diguanylate cyclase [Halieaceae bacterium]